MAGQAEYLRIIADAALALKGCGYIYGATGWVCTQARIEQQAAQYPEYADTIRKYGPKWIGKRCYDCAQLTRTAARVAGISLPSGATSQWNAAVWAVKGTIDTLPMGEPGILLYRMSGGKMQHTGVSLGDGTFVDARGHAYGVLHSAISAYAWTHWGRLKAPESAKESEEGLAMQEGQKAVVVATSGSTVNLRQLPDTKGTLIAKVPVGSTVDVLEVGSEWCTVAVGGKRGYMMRQFLALEGAAGGVNPEDGANVPQEDYAALLARVEALEARMDTLKAGEAG